MLLGCALWWQVQAQSVAINTDGSLPHNSAILDIRSNSKGVVLPRLTLAQLKYFLSAENIINQKLGLA